MAKSDISQAQDVTKKAIGTATGYGTKFTDIAGPGFEQFATTGGVTPAERTAAQQVGAGGVRSLFSSLADRLNRQRMIQGGYSPGYGANIAALGRAGGAALGETAAGTELSLDEMVRQGRLQGLGGISNLAQFWGGQTPQLTGQYAQLAEAKPSWMQQLGQFTGAIAPLMGGMGSIFTGLGNMRGGPTAQQNLAAQQFS